MLTLACAHVCVHQSLLSGPLTQWDTTQWQKHRLLILEEHSSVLQRLCCEKETGHKIVHIVVPIV